MPTDRALQRLCSGLCADLGFSLDSATVAALAQEHSQDIEQFTRSVFRAEGLDPDLADKRLYRQVRDRIREELALA